MKIKFIVMSTALFFTLSRAEAQNCTGCANTLSGGGTSVITVTTGETLCLLSGTFKPKSISIASGGTLCIGSGVTLQYTHYGFTIGGTVINHGSLSFEGTGNLGTGDIDNYGTITQTGYIGSIGLNINNHGTINIGGQIGSDSGSLTNDSGAVFKTTNTIQNFSGTITNYGLFQTEKLISLSGTYIDNRDSFILTSNSGIQGTFDNSGYASFSSLTSGTGLSATVNNYGILKSSGQVNVGTATYFTNDSIAIFGGANVNFEGAMLTNNNKLYVTGGNFEVNSPQMDFVNTGLLVVDGVFQYNAASSGANNCRIFASGGITIHGADFKNYGLLWSGSTFSLTSGSLINYSTGFIRGVNFSNSGSITGVGSLYFTGTSLTNSGGSLIGDSASDKIQFYTPAGNSITTGTVQNVSFFANTAITPLDTNSFNCNAAPSIPAAGNPPYVRDTTITECSIGVSDTFYLITDSLITPYDNTYSIYWPALKLFDPANSSNPTNNTTNLVTTQGTWVADTVNKIIAFTPAASFTSGTAKAQFVAADKTSGSPITNTSNKATIKIILSPAIAPNTLQAEGY